MPNRSREPGRARSRISRAAAAIATRKAVPVATPAAVPVVAAFLAITLAACSPAPVQIAPAATVIATTPISVAAAEAHHYPGEVHARYETPIGFRVAGQLVERYVHLGDTVHRGQALARIDAGDSNAQLAAARAALASANQRLVLARQTHDRNARESEADLISQSQREQGDAQLAVAEADVEQARQQVALAGNQERYTTLVADHDGIITSENAEVGAVLAAGAPVFGFAWAGERDVVIDVPEQRIAGVRAGQGASVALWSQPDKPVRAVVRDVAQAADRDSRSFRVKLALDASAAATAPGLTASVTLDDVRSIDPLRIPATALFHDGHEPAVWVIEPATHVLVLRRVTVSRYGESDVDVSSGLAPGDAIVAQGVHTVTAGQHVAPLAATANAS